MFYVAQDNFSSSRPREAKRLETAELDSGQIWKVHKLIQSDENQIIFSDIRFVSSPVSCGKQVGEGQNWCSEIHGEVILSISIRDDGLGQ